VPRPRQSLDADSIYEPIWSRLAERIEREVAAYAKERSTAAALASELLALEPAARQAAVRGEVRWQTVAVVQELIRRGQTALPEDPPAARQPLGCALDLVRQLPAAQSKGMIANLRAEALGVLAESHLGGGDCEWAERFLNQAAGALWDSPDSEAHGHFCQRMAQLRSRQGRLDEAVSLLTQAAELARAVGDLARAGQLQSEERQLGEKLSEDASCPDEAAVSGVSAPHTRAT
jgi:hypothetical protein